MSGPYTGRSGVAQISDLQLPPAATWPIRTAHGALHHAWPHHTAHAHIVRRARAPEQIKPPPQRSHRHGPRAILDMAASHHGWALPKSLSRARQGRTSRGLRERVGFRSASHTRMMVACSRPHSGTTHSAPSLTRPTTPPKPLPRRGGERLAKSSRPCARPRRQAAHTIAEPPARDGRLLRTATPVVLPKLST